MEVSFTSLALIYPIYWQGRMRASFGGTEKYRGFKKYFLFRVK